MAFSPFKLIPFYCIYFQSIINMNRSTFVCMRLHSCPYSISCVEEGSRHMMALNLICGFEYARSCSEDQFFQLSYCRGQCTCHAIIKTQARGGISAQRRGEQESKKVEWKRWLSCSGVFVCVCMSAVPDP